MSTRRYDEAKLRELEDKGVSIDWDALKVPFNLGVTSIITADVDSNLLEEFKSEIKNAIRKSEFSCELKDILIFLMILNPEITIGKESISWKRKEEAYIIRKNINFLDWKIARASRRKELMVEATIDAILRIPEKRLSTSSKDRLIEIISQVGKKMRQSRRK